MLCVAIPSIVFIPSPFYKDDYRVIVGHILCVHLAFGISYFLTSSAFKAMYAVFTFFLAALLAVFILTVNLLFR